MKQGLKPRPVHFYEESRSEIIGHQKNIASMAPSMAAPGRSATLLDHAKSFIAGFAYGATSVVVGQPLDTIKTRVQAVSARGGGGPLSVGAAIWRAARHKTFSRSTFHTLWG